MFRNQQYMTDTQATIASEFTQMIEAEYALCSNQMRLCNQVAMEKLDSSDSEEKISINYACLEIDAIRGYWFNRLVAMMQLVEKRNPELATRLAKKYVLQES